MREDWGLAGGAVPRRAHTGLPQKRGNKGAPSGKCPTLIPVIRAELAYPKAAELISFAPLPYAESGLGTQANSCYAGAWLRASGGTPRVALRRGRW